MNFVLKNRIINYLNMCVFVMKLNGHMLQFKASHNGHTYRFVQTYTGHCSQVV